MKLIEELLIEFGLEAKRDTLDIKTLKKLDSLIQIRPNSKQIKDKFFINFIAILGELLIQEQKTKWKIARSKQHRAIWYPNLSYKGQVIPLVVYLFEAFDDNTRVPLTSTYDLITFLIKKTFS